MQFLKKVFILQIDEDQYFVRQIIDVPEVMNVHMNEIHKKLTTIK